jgi:DNA modification methylase
MNNYTPTAEPKALASGVPVYCAHDAIVDVAKLVPNPKNPNTHPDSQIQLLGRIIRQTGWRQPITVSNRSGFIVKGHGRLAAALLEGFKAVPVDYQNYDSEAQEYADLVADNRIAELAEIDNKLLADIFENIDTGEIPLELSGYTEKEVEDIVTALCSGLQENGEKDRDDVPEAPEPEDVITQTGDLWILGRHRLLCGDSTDKATVLKMLDGEKADMVFTDPPYGVNVKGGKSKGNLIMGDLTQTAIPFSFEIAVMNATKEKAHFYFCGGESNLQLYQKLFDRYLHILPKHLIWVKNGFVMKQVGYHNQFEIIFHGYKEGSGNKWYSGRTENEASDVWHINRDAASAYEHPTQKPVELPMRAIKNSCPPNGTVYEPFCGSGSTLIGCEQLGRTCYALELDPRFCDVIARRYARTTGDTAGIRLIRDGKELGREYFEEMFSE